MCDVYVVFSNVGENTTFFMFSITSLKLEEYHSHLSLIHVFMVQAHTHTHSLTHTISTINPGTKQTTSKSKSLF